MPPRPSATNNMNEACPPYNAKNVWRRRPHPQKVLTFKFKLEIIKHDVNTFSGAAGHTQRTFQHFNDKYASNKSDTIVHFS